jgi:hypothetical protein
LRSVILTTSVTALLSVLKITLVIESALLDADGNHAETARTPGVSASYFRRIARDLSVRLQYWKPQLTIPSTRTSGGKSRGSILGEIRMCSERYCMIGGDDGWEGIPFPFKDRRSRK